MNTLKKALTEIPAYSHLNKTLFEVLLLHELRHDRNILLSLVVFHLTLDLGSRDQTWWDLFPGLKEEPWVIDLEEVRLKLVHQPTHSAWSLEVQDHRDVVHYSYSLSTFPLFKEMLGYYL